MMYSKSSNANRNVSKITLGAMGLASLASLFSLTPLGSTSEAYAADPSREEVQLLLQQVEQLQRQNEALNKRLSIMEQRLEKSQSTPQATGTGNRQLPAGVNETVMEQDIASEEEEEGIGRISKYLTIGGLLEGDYILSKDFGGTHGSEFDLATAELYLDAQLTDWARGYVGIEYLHDNASDGDSDKLHIDEAHITLGNTEQFPLFLKGGKLYVPFGDYSTNMLQDPFTQTLGETRDTGVVVGFTKNGFTAAAFAYNGMDKDDPANDTINGFGASLDYAYEVEDRSFHVGASWITNLADSKEMSAVVQDNIQVNLGPDGALSDEIPAYALFFHGRLAAYSLSTGYVAALDRFHGDEFAYGEALEWLEGENGPEAVMIAKGAKPSAWNIELAYTTSLWDLETIFAVGYQQSWEAVQLELPESRYLAIASINIFKGTALSLEYAYDEDYSLDDGGTGNNGYSLTTRLAYEF